MTVCDVCGTEVDPDVIHIQHGSGACDGDWGPSGCGCPEVCAACCTDPDCPGRTPEENAMGQTPTDSPPETDLLYVAWSIIANARDWLLDDNQAHEWVEAAKRWRDEYHATLSEVSDDPQPLTDDELQPGRPLEDVVIRTLRAGFAQSDIGTLEERLVATVEQTRRERDAAYEALLRVLGIPDEDWLIDMWSEEYEGCVGMFVPTCICERYYGDKGACYCCDPINLTASQVDAIRRARAGSEEGSDG